MTAYYNELDPKAAAWLRELIKGGHIAAGNVDETDIRDVDPARLARYTQCHFFAGIGGWSAALRLAGWPDDRPVWTGSCPCQPFSAAGRREGVADERHLWPHWHHLISVCRPSVVFGEQVASKDGLGWLDLVSADMEGSGYAIGAADLCAAGVGAPHIRQRLYFGAVRLADADGPRQHQRGLRHRGEFQQGAWPSQGKGSAQTGIAVGLGQDVDLADSSGLGNAIEPTGQWHAGGFPTTEAKEHGTRISVDGGVLIRPEHAGTSVGGLADADSAGWIARQWDDQAARHGHTAAAEGGDGGLADAADAGLSVGRGGSGWTPGSVEQSERLRADVGLADACDDGSQGWLPRRQDAGREDLDRQAGCDGADCRPRPTDGIWRDADWLFCRDGKWRPVEPGTFPLAHGVSARVGRLRGYGNAIVPQVAATFIRSVI